MTQTAAAADPGVTAPIRPLVLWMTLAVVLIADGLDLVDATITNIAAPSVVADLGGGASLVTWLGAAYALALGSLLVVGGRLGDRWGQRRVLLTGMAGFVVASALAGLATGPVMLVAARAVQGGFGALLIPQGMAIMTRTFPRELLAKAFAAFGPLLGVFAVGGPLLGGLLIDADLFGLGWRPVFLVNIVLGGLGLVLAIRFCPDVDADPSVRIDPLGSVLLAVAAVGLIYGLTTGSAAGWPGRAVAALAVAAVAAAGFARRQGSADQPLLAPGLLRNRGFTSGLLVGLLVFAVFSGLTYVISLYLQLGLGYSPSGTSLALLPLTVGIIIASAAGMALVSRIGRTMVLAGLLLTLAGAGLLLLVVRTAGSHATWWQLAAATLVIGMGAGACFSSIFDIALGDVDHDEAGAASGSLSAVQQIAAGAGSALVTSVYLGSVAAGQVRAMSISLVAVLIVCALSLLAVPLLPVRGAGLEH